MKITLVPQRSDESLSLRVDGDTLVINGGPLDFSPLAEGFELPIGAVLNNFVVGVVRRVGGEIEVMVRLPYGHTPGFDISQYPVVHQSTGEIEVPK